MYKFCITNCVSNSRTQTEVFTRFSSRNDTQKYKRKVYKDSKIFTLDSMEGLENQEKLMCNNREFVHKSEVDPARCAHCIGIKPQYPILCQSSWLKHSQSMYQYISWWLACHYTNLLNPLSNLPQTRINISSQIT